MSSQLLGDQERNLFTGIAATVFSYVPHYLVVLVLKSRHSWLAGGGVCHCFGDYLTGQNFSPPSLQLIVPRRGHSKEPSGDPTGSRDGKSAEGTGKNGPALSPRENSYCCTKTFEPNGEPTAGMPISILSPQQQPSTQRARRATRVLYRTQKLELLLWHGLCETARSHPPDPRTGDRLSHRPAGSGSLRK